MKLLDKRKTLRKALKRSINIVQRLMKVFGVRANQWLNEDESTTAAIQNKERNEQPLFTMTHKEI